MSSTQDYVALDWIKGEIGQTLGQAKDALEAMAEAPDDLARMRPCLTALHQVHGTLKMVELGGPTVLAEEMEGLAQALMNEQAPDVGLAQEVLMQAILQMPAYLDKIQRDQADSEANYLSLANSLRGARALDPIAATEASQPEAASDGDYDLAPFLAPADDAILAPYQAAKGRPTIHKLRARFQQALLAIVKKSAPRENLGTMAKVFAMLAKLGNGAPTGHLAQLAVALVEQVIAGSVKLSNDVLGLLRQVDAEMKRLVDDGDEAILAPVSGELAGNLLAALAAGTKPTPRATALLARYQAGTDAPASSQQGHGIGPDDETLAAVAKILIEELGAVTDKLDLYVRASDRSPTTLVELIANLEQISSTLVVVGMADHQATVQRQIVQIKGLDDSDPVTDDFLLDMAKDLLGIEASLGGLLGGDEDGGDSEVFGDLDDAQAAVIRETRNGLATCKDAVIDFVSADFAIDNISELPDNLRSLRGGLLIANQERAGAILVAAAEYVDANLLGGQAAPNLAAMDDLADAITSVDYYLERLLENPREPYLQMLGVAEEAVTKLQAGDSPDADAAVPEAVPATDEATVAVEADTAEEAAALPGEALVEPDEEVPDGTETLTLDDASAAITVAGTESADDLEAAEADAPDETTAETQTAETFTLDDLADEEVLPEAAVDPGAVDGTDTVDVAEPAADSGDDLIDDEILEIFIEEAEEVLETINEYFPQWRANPGDEAPLAEVRRAFHTLKGSGRMVGATVLGEMAWSVENMLNRVIDETVVADDTMMSLIAEVISRIPAGVSLFKEGRQDEFVVADLAAAADAIARGEAPTVEPLVSVETTDAPAIEAAAGTGDVLIDEPAADTVTLEPAEHDGDIDLVTSDVTGDDAGDGFALEALDELPDTDIDSDAIEDDFVLDTTLSSDADGSSSPDTSDEDIDDADLALDATDTATVDESSLATLAESDADTAAEPAIADADVLDLSLDVDSADDEITDDGFILGQVDDDEAESFTIETVDEAVDAPDLAADGETDDTLTLETWTDSADEPVSEPADTFTLDAVRDATDLDETDAPATPLEADEDEALTTVAPTTDDDADGFELEALDIEEDFADDPLLTDVGPDVPVETSAAELAANDDLSLEEIFAIEAGEKLAVIQAALQQPGPLQPDVVAAFHTLKGSAAMTEIGGVAAIAAPMEQLTNRYLQNNQAVDDNLIGLIVAAHGAISGILADLEGRRDGNAEDAALIASIEAALASGDASASPDAFDFTGIALLSREDVVSLGLADAHRGEILAELDNILAQASERDQGAVADLVAALQRVYREAAPEPRPESLLTLQQGHERLVLMLDQIAASQAVIADEGLVVALRSLDVSAPPVAEPEPTPVAEALPDIDETTVAADADAAAVLEPEPEPPVEEPPAPVTQRVELPADDTDMDILPIFLEETEELLEGIDQSILDWSNAPGDLEHLDLLLRHLHTLKGGARMAGLNSLGEYTHNFETLLINLRAQPEAFDEAFFAMVNQRQDEITRRVEIYTRLAGGNASEAELASMQFEESIAPSEATAPASEPAPAESLAAPETGAEEELPADEIDEDVLPIFLEESEELLEEIDASIQAWSQAPDDAEPLDNLLRQLHTVKGGSRMAGLNSLGEYTHNFETYLIGLRNNPVPMDESFFAHINQRQDEITRRVEIYNRIAAGEASAEDIASLTRSISQAAPGASTAATEPAPAAPETPAAQPTDSAGAAVNQEMVRVSSDLLESLIGLAGESSITRGRVEQQISDFTESIEEMEATIGRVRDQVRRLEIEAESRETLVRTQSEAGDSAFDELEMDRYTMLQEISRALSEGTSDMLDLKDTLVNRARDAETLLHQQGRIGSELQEGLTRTRMVPFARLIPRLRRIVRQISGEVGKSVRFDAFNVEGELDRSVLERIVAPLEHMLRNAVDHGIEPADKRAEAGKAEQGRISLRLSREGGYVVLTVSDDGGGINVDAVRSKAIERGLMTDDTPLSDHDVMQFILHAGFSTAQKLTQISGRGVGMDVVVSEIKALGGAISIDSTLGVGTEFTIRIPFTVSINRALMVVVREETYAIPLNTIEGIVRVSPYELEAYYQPDAPMFEYAGQPYRLDYMGKILERSETPNLAGQIAPLPVILARSGDNAVALQVDQVIGSREVVVKSLGHQFNDVGGVAGATVLGDGSVVVILDVMALVRSYDLQTSAPLPVAPEEPVPVNAVRTVMIVDDSVTVRKVTSRLMERQGWEVETAKDGVDAMSQLQEIYPDIVLLDIEMPKMDGFEVLRSVRRDERLKDLPIIMITSRTGEKHREQALELGVNRYLGKPFQEASLLETIEEVLREAKTSRQE